MSKLLPRFFAVLLAIGCCSQGWAQLAIESSCVDGTTVQCLADLDAITCPDDATVTLNGDPIGDASCILISQRDSAAQLCTATTANPVTGSNAGALVLYNIDDIDGVESEYYVPTGAGLTLSRFASGQAILSGTVQGVNDASEQWNVFLVYENMVSDDDHVNGGGGLKYDAACAPIDPANVDWDIYYMNNSMSFLQGEGSLTGSLLELNHAPSNQYFGFQVGAGANDRNCNFGAGGWFSWTGTVLNEDAAGAMGDVLVDLDCQNLTYDPCTASVTCVCAGINPDTNEFAVSFCTTTREDTTGPEFQDLPADTIYVACTDEIPAPEVLTALDNCEPENQEVITAVHTGDFILAADSTAPWCYEVNRTWAATDFCGNESGFTQIIIVQDLFAPVWDTYTPYVMESCLVILTQDEAEDPSLVPITATDNCDPDLDYSIEAHEISGGCPTTWLRKWTATDDCGNASVVVEQYVQLYDETPPAITAPGTCTVYNDAACESNVDPIGEELNGFVGVYDPANWLVVTDDSDASVDFSADGTTLEITGSDAGNSNSLAKACIMTQCDITVTFDWDYSTDDEFGSEFDPAYYLNDVRIDLINDGSLTGSGTLTITVASGTLLGFGIESTDGILGAAYLDISGFSVIHGTGLPTYSDHCTDQALLDENLEYSDELSAVTCTGDDDTPEGSYTITRTWSTTDFCLNVNSDTQTIYVVDTISPVGTVHDDTLDCAAYDAQIEYGSASGTDNCDTHVSYTWTTVTDRMDADDEEAPGCYYYDREYTFVDDCGNSSTEMQRVWLTDTTPPVLISAEENRIVTCEAYNENQGGLLITASDDCGDVTITFEDEILSGGCVLPVGRYERTYTISDDCGNSINFTQFLLLTDNDAPELTVDCPDHITINSDEYCSNESLNTAVTGLPDYTVTDGCQDSVDVFVTRTFEDGSPLQTCEGVYSFTRTWTVFAIDPCYNFTSETCTQQITVLDEIAPAAPGIDCPDDIILNVDENCEVNTMPGVTGMAEAMTLDNCDANPEIFVGYLDSDYDYTCEADAGSAFELTASLGALATASASLEDDITAVGISLDLDWAGSGCTEWPSDLTLEITSPNGECATIAIADAAETACDDYSYPESWNTTTPGNFLIDFELENTLSGDGTWSLEVTNTWAGACAADFDLTATLIRRAEGSYTFTRTWSAYAKDCAGNESSKNYCDQQITVLDEIAPTIDASSPGMLTIACDEFDESTVYGVTASDNCDSNVKVEVLYNEDCDGDDAHGFSNNEVSGDCGGSYIRTYLATDDCGNTATFEQIVNLEDNVAPEITLLCPGPITISKDEDCFANDTRSGAGEADYIATDNCALDSVCVIVDDSDNVYSCPNSYSFVRTWTVKAYDVCENEAIATCSQTVTVVDDTAPAAPAFDCPGTLTVYRDGNCESDAGPDADPILNLSNNDNCSLDADLIQHISFADDTVGDQSCNHEIHRTWSASLEDECGNVSELTTCVQTILVQDTLDPSISLESVYAIDCALYDPNGIYATASDNCDGSPDLVFDYRTAVTSSNLEDCAGIYVHHYTATDCSENSFSTSHLVQLIDTVAPVFESFPDDAVLQCGSATGTDALGVPTFSDNCAADEVLTLSHEDVISTYKADDCQTVERHWTIEDPCGNATTQIQTYQIEDSEYPVITNEAADLTVECDGEGNTEQFEEWLATYGGATATDNCTYMLIWDYEVPVVSAGINPMLSDGCGATGEVTVTFYATDACGNSTPTTATFTIVDTVAPELASFDFPDDIDLTQNNSCDINTGVNLTGVASATAGDDDCCYTSVSISHEDGPVICLCGQDDDYMVLPELIEEDLLTYASIEAAIDGTVSFDWEYNTEDVEGAFFDVAFYLDDVLIDVAGADEQSGSFSIEAEAGQTIAMGIASIDGLFGGASLLISNFSGPSGEDFIGVYESAEWTTYDGYNGSNTFSHDGETLLIEGTNVDLDCEGSYAFLRTWTVFAYDECGNESDHVTHAQLISVLDLTVPQFTETCEYTNGQVINVDCGSSFGDLDIPAACNVEADDKCDSDVTITCAVDTMGEFAPNDEVVLYSQASTPAAFSENGTCNGMDPHAMRLIGMPNADEFYTLTGGGVAEHLASGEIVLTAELTSTQVPNAGWNLSLTLDPDAACGISHTGGQLISCDPVNALGLSLDDVAVWQYYILNCNASTLSGFGPYSSGELTLSHQPANGHYAFQLGEGANQQNANFGLSGWFYYEGHLQNEQSVMGSGDLFFDMDCCLPWSITHTCTAVDDCGNDNVFSYTFQMSGDVASDDDSELSGQGGSGDHTPVVIGGAGDLTTGKTPIRVTNLQPNPTNDVSQLGFVVTENMRIRVDLIGMDGVLVTELYDGIAQSGVNHTLDIDADGLSNGMYQIRLSSNDYLVVKKLLVSE